VVDKDPIAAAAEAVADALLLPSQLGSVKVDAPLTGRQKFRLVGLVILKRVRFIAILVAVGVFIGSWDTIKNYWDKVTRPQALAVKQLEAGQEFYCPMDPQVVRSTFEPNGDVPKCPICGMPLSARKKGEAVPLPEGVTGRVQLSPERVQLAGIKTAPVAYRPMAQETTTVGYVTFDESRLSKITSRVSGYVEKLYVDKTFTTVRQGDVLAEIYSPELYSTAQELLLAARTGPRSDLVASARKRLELLGVGAEEIDAIVRSGKAASRLVIRSPQQGYVIEKKIVAGSSVDPGMTLMEVADLSSVWVEAEVYEKDLALLRTGEKVVATVETFPNRAFTGRLALVYPRLDVATRTNRIRFELENPGHDLRPGMFATVNINTPLEAVEPFRTLASSKGQGKVVFVKSTSATAPPEYEFLAVPERAVIDTGKRKVVYVEREPGLFEGVEVELGPRSGDYFPVVKGLNPGDKIAAAGGFLIDAETRLNPAAAATYFGASGGPQSGAKSGAPAAPTARPGGQGTPREAEPAPATPKPKVALAKPTAEDLENVAQLPDGERQLALAQKLCPVTEKPLGSMGVPMKILLRGQPVILCCKGCVGKAKRNPEETLQRVSELKRATSP
jgi:Cu(I)/Ag(I) efflux system membrane fusion protein